MAKKQRRMKDRDNNNTPSNWQNLPQDIMICIAELLSLDDQIILCAVCKNWRLIRHTLKSKFPLLLSLDVYKQRFNMQWYNLYDPRQRIAYVVKNRRKTKNGISFDSNYSKKRTYMSHDLVLAVRSRWLLLEKVTDTQLYLFNPFTKVSIDLPAFWMSSSVYRSTFSCLDSGNILVFLVENCDFFGWNSFDRRENKGIWIKAWHSGDGSETQFERLRDFESRDILDLISIKETLYCIFKNGMVGEFSVVTEDWNVIVASEDIKTGKLKRHFAQWSRSSKTKQYIAVECEGDIFIVCTKEKGSSAISWDIYKLDWKEKTWIEEDFSLSDKVLFLCYYGNKIESTFMFQANDSSTKDLAGRIYYSSALNSDCYFYHPNCGHKLAFKWPQSAIYFESTRDYFLWMDPPPP